MFAVIKTGGKQYKVQSGDVLRVEKLAADAGETIQFNEILMLGGDKPVVGTPMVDGAAVQAEVMDQIKGEKLIHFVKRRRKHSSKRTKGHRQQLTLLRITDILATGADKSGVKAALAGAGFISATQAAAGKGAPTSKKAAANAERASQPKKAAAEKKAAPAKAAPAKAAAAAAGNDLTEITGVGPAAAKKLIAAGINTFADLAKVDVDSFDAVKVKPEWVAQAAELAK